MLQQRSPLKPPASMRSCPPKKLSPQREQTSKSFSSFALFGRDLPSPAKLRLPGRNRACHHLQRTFSVAGMAQVRPLGAPRAPDMYDLYVLPISGRARFLQLPARAGGRSTAPASSSTSTGPSNSGPSAHAWKCTLRASASTGLTLARTSSAQRGSAEGCLVASKPDHAAGPCVAILFCVLRRRRPVKAPVFMHHSHDECLNWSPEPVFELEPGTRFVLLLRD